MPDSNIDMNLVKDRFEKSFKNSPGAGIVQAGMAKYLVEQLLNHSPIRHYSRVLEIGCGVNPIAHECCKHLSTVTWSAIDIVPVENEFLACMKEVGISDCNFIEGDMEITELPKDQDLIISNAAVQWAKRPAEFIEHLVSRLATGGVLALATFGPNNLYELRELTGLSLNYLPSSAYPSLLSHAGEVLYLEEMRSVMEFEEPLDVLKHIRATGTNSLSKSPWTKSDIKSFVDNYRLRFSDDDKVTLSYYPLYVIFRKHFKESA
ncbi:hypothetical protein BVX97_02320 [bacterium E08(2017)]|nr:hypothetical protein BVX97_02320 [bacterium E08(2017)]